MKKVCVYCASSAQIPEIYFKETAELAKAFVANKIEVVFGGGATGLMGQLADTMLEQGGKIKGIMPQFMNEIEWAHRGVSDFEFTETMHERKAKFLEGIDGIVALAGGSGTLEELLEAITLKRLGQFTKPIVILNTNGYYNPLREMLQRSIDQNFMHEKHNHMYDFVNDVSQVIPALNNGKSWTEDAIQFASL